MREHSLHSIFTVLVLIIGLSVCAQTSDTLVLSTTLPTDTLLNVAARDSIVYEEDEMDLEYEVNYFGKDSTVVDIVNQRIMMYGGGWVKYGKMEVKADYIDFSLRNYTATAIGKRDSLGNVVEKATFTEGENTFDEDSLMYNFNTKRGVSYGVRTMQSDAYLLAGVSKKASNDWISIKSGKFTTCDNPNPHYHFHLTKAMAVPDDKIVSGPLYLKFRKIPTPLALPFGFFPNKRESTHGILLPGYGNGATKGYYLQNLGYYIPMGQYLDTKFLFDLYTRGSWSASNITNYKKLYKYNGSFDVSRTINKDGMPEIPSSYSKSTNFNIRWNHSQDPRARPNSTFNASVNLGSSQNFRNNLNSSQTNFLSSTFASQIAWSKNFPDTPFNLGVNLGHTQNTQTRQVDVTLPVVSVNMRRIMLGKFVSASSPFKKVLDNVGVSANANASNRVSANESMFSLSNMEGLNRISRNGVQLQGSMSTAGTILKYITTTGTLNGSYIGTMKQVKQGLGEDMVVKKDTVFGYLDAFNFNASADMNFRVYGMYNFRRGNVRAIRHVVMPRAGFSYTPYSDSRDYYIGQDGMVKFFNPFDVAAYMPQSSREGLNANFSIRQNLEMKVRDKAATKPNATKKIMLIDNWNMSTSYNMMADSLKLSGLTMGASTSLMNKFNVSYNSLYSFYSRDTLGREVNRFLASEGGGLMRMRSTSLALSFNLKSNEKNKLKKEKQEFAKEEHDLLAESKGSLVDLSVPWNLSVSYSMNFTNNFDKVVQRDTLAIRQGVMFNGSLTLLKYWAFTFNSGYDFSNLNYSSLRMKDFGVRNFTTTTVGLVWDLHCWEFSASYVPFGIRKSYMFQLNIKSALLQDLKLQRRGNLGDKDLLY